MNVAFYRFSGEANLVDKTNMLSNAVTLQCNLKENTSVINPSILLNMSAINRNVTTYNYCYIELFGRYYFVDDVIIEANNIIRFNLSVDVLMSYKTFLFGQKALISRNQYLSDELAENGFQIDNRMPFSNKYNVQVQYSTRLFNSIKNNDDFKFGWYCLTCFGLGQGWFPADERGFMNPYGTFSHTVLIKTNLSRGADQLLGEIIKTIGSDYEGVGSYVVSMYCLPYDCTPYLSSVNDVLVIGKASIDLTPFKSYGEYVYNAKNPSINPRLTININNVNSYKDLTPYSDYKIHLPFVGLIDVPIESFNVNSKSFNLYLDSTLDFTIGSITYRLMYKLNETYIIANEISVECMNPVPISASNAETINRSKDAYLASFMGDTIATGVVSAVGIIAGAATGNYMLAAMSAASGIAKPIASGVKADYDLKKMVPTGTVQKSASMYGSFNLYSEPTGNQVINPDVNVIKIIREPLNNNDDYYRLNGHVCHAIKELSEVYGYTEISDIHLEIPSILTEESDILASLLSSGVIFPEPPT